MVVLLTRGVLRMSWSSDATGRKSRKPSELLRSFVVEGT